MTFIDLLKELIATSKERLKNPFVGAFVSSWIVFNWRPLAYFVFSNEKIDNKILAIDECYLDWWNGLVYPLITASVYLLLLPYLTQFFDWVVISSVKKRKEYKTTVREVDIINETKLLIVQNELEDAKAKNKDKTELNNEIDSLKKVIDASATTIKEQKKELKERDLEVKSFENDLTQLTRDYQVLESTDLKVIEKLNKNVTNLETELKEKTLTIKKGEDQLSSVIKNNRKLKDVDLKYIDKLTEQVTSLGGKLQEIEKELTKNKSQTKEKQQGQIDYLNRLNKELDTLRSELKAKSKVINQLTKHNIVDPVSVNIENIEEYRKDFFLFKSSMLYLDFFRVASFISNNQKFPSGVSDKHKDKYSKEGLTGKVVKNGVHETIHLTEKGRYFLNLEINT